MNRSASETYVGFIKGVNYLKSQTDISELFNLLANFEKYKTQIPFFKETVFFIIDYTKSRHLLMTGDVKGIIGYHPRDFLDGGLDFLIDRFQPDDFRIFNEHVFKTNFQFLKSTPQEDHQKYLFETNYRLRRREKGENVTVLQRSSYLTDPETSLPTYCFGICFDITAFKRDDTIVRKISKEDSGGKTELVQTLSTDHFYPDPEKSVLSRREVELLKWVAEGYSTKQIAEKFSISVNTAMNHRKNMLRKTNSKNVAELISYAIRERII